MRNRRTALCLLLLWLPIAFAQYRTAQPGYSYKFPRDHFAHPDFQTEWWYYTGHLVAQDGRHFGFELTFFRQAVSRDALSKNTWDIQDLYLAHFALSDLDGGKFFHTERVNRQGPGIAGTSFKQQRIWNGNWQALWKGEDQQLQAFADPYSLELSLHPEKPLVIHGVGGVSQKSEGPGHASHYISFTRLATSGTITLGGKTVRVSGTSWMDHEFFTQQLDADQAGWDWFSLQLEDNTELMLFRIRRKDGSLDPYSAGTYVDAQGKSQHLGGAEFALIPLEHRWRSPVTSARYPTEWTITVPKLGIDLIARTVLDAQELSGTSKLSPSYWEGAISLAGNRGGRKLAGAGYLEMTGYDHPMGFGP
jgi:predicted secreted hydrolase